MLHRTTPYTHEANVLEVFSSSTVLNAFTITNATTLHWHAVSYHSTRIGEKADLLQRRDMQRQRSLFLMDKIAEEIQRIICDDLRTDIRRALYWLRWTYNARTLPEAFLFAWMALERLAGEKQISTRCSTCGEPIRCPKHGERHYSTVPRSAIKALLERHGVANAETLLSLRNPLVHGSLEHSFEMRVDIKRTLPDLVHAIEEELRTRLNAKQALHTSPLTGPGDEIISAHCEYITAFPDEAFPSDCPTFAEVKEYQEAVRQGHQHPKIINLVPSSAVEW